MASGRSNISRSIWRFFEIALFFVVSVVGFSMYAKTTTLNAKQKSRALQQQGPDCPAELYSSGPTLFLHSHFLHKVPIYGKADHKHASGITVQLHHAPQASAIMHPRLPILSISQLPIPVLTELPCNLLQQNPVLLI